MTPRTARQFREIREEKKALIMDVALEHFANKGYHITTISHIARHAGISKGLMYNYFESKEQLLTEIINRSMEEVAVYLDPDNDGYLSEEEFELFIRKLFLIIRDKITFWRLFYQMLIQKEVRIQLIKSTLDPTDSVQGPYTTSNNFLTAVVGMISDYFNRKKDRNSEYDPLLEMNMFIYTVEGFAIISVYMEKIDDEYYQKAINRIIELYK